eukprot:gb/GEZJ01004458.1/.p1 GENE.gb/GEZJ01004458.1/~~gb/GEZJ01004458.1/.p1  ORF type:complete len:124 (-),score=7.97 gb/GEZJ01004458.1/:705-1076(-)
MLISQCCENITYKDIIALRLSKASFKHFIRHAFYVHALLFCKRPFFILLQHAAPLAAPSPNIYHHKLHVLQSSPDLSSPLRSPPCHNFVRTLHLPRPAFHTQNQTKSFSLIPIINLVIMNNGI